MKINSLSKHIEDAETRVATKFYPTSQDMAHATKRVIAMSPDDPAEFTEAAAIEGMTTQQLRDVILAKPDEIMRKENERRRIVLRLRQATNKADVDAICVEENIPAKFF